MPYSQRNLRKMSNALSRLTKMKKIKIQKGICTIFTKSAPQTITWWESDFLAASCWQHNNNNKKWQHSKLMLTNKRNNHKGSHKRLPCLNQVPNAAGSCSASTNECRNAASVGTAKVHNDKHRARSNRMGWHLERIKIQCRKDGDS